MLAGVHGGAGALGGGLHTCLHTELYAAFHTRNIHYHTYATYTTLRNLCHTYHTPNMCMQNPCMNRIFRVTTHALTVHTQHTKFNTLRSGAS